ncbi:hypothetical protein EMCRGX_G017935 [Ephydatia muelleri]
MHMMMLQVELMSRPAKTWSTDLAFVHWKNCKPSSQGQMQFHLKDSAEKCRITFIEGPNDHERLPTGSTCALELQLASYEDYGTFREWIVVPSEAVAHEVSVIVLRMKQL